MVAVVERSARGDWVVVDVAETQVVKDRVDFSGEIGVFVGE